MQQSQLYLQGLDGCFQQLMALSSAQSVLSIDQIAGIIDKYHPIEEPQLPSLVVTNSTRLLKVSSQQFPSSQQQLQQQYYEQKFIPSPQLLLNYQQIFIKTLPAMSKSQGENNTTYYNNDNKLLENIAGIYNNKLNRLYRQHTAVNNNIANPYCSQTNTLNEPITLPYRTLSSTYNQFPTRAENQRVFIQKKQQTILQHLQHNTHCVQTTIPIIENSLFQNEIKRLQQKQIQLENIQGVKAWKLKREQMINQIATNNNSNNR